MANVRVPKALLFDIERHCNNYFNHDNEPSNPKRNYPPGFMDLARRIMEYDKNMPRNNTTHETSDKYSYSVDLEYASWQKAFAKELSIYKRARFI